MKKTICNLSIIITIAGTYACSSPETNKEAITTEDGANTEEQSTIVGNSGNSGINDTIKVGHEVKTLGDEVDSLLKDI